MSRAYGCSEMPQINKNHLPDLLRTMPVKVSIKYGKLSNKTTIGKRLERLMRLGLLVRRKALDWTLSRRQRVDDLGFWSATAEVEVLKNQIRRMNDFTKIPHRKSGIFGQTTDTSQDD